MFGVRLENEIARRCQLGQEAAEQGDRLEAVYQLGYTNGLERWRAAINGSRQALLRLNGGVYLGRHLQRRRWRFDLLAGNGDGRLYATVRDGIAHRRREVLGPVIFLLEEEAGALLGSLELEEET
jgi:hypothetical protein